MPAASPAGALSSADVVVSLNVGRRLGRGEIDAAIALRWLRGWVQLSTPRGPTRITRDTLPAGR
jgi:hypothetical protein